MLLREELLSENSYILVAETLARSQSEAHELCTIPADRMLPRTAADSTAGGPTVPFALAAGSLVRRPHLGQGSAQLPGLFMLPCAYQGYCPP